MRLSQKLQNNIIVGLYSYFSKQFNIITELGDRPYTVTMGVEVDGTIVELVEIDEQDNWNVEDRSEELESKVYENFERLKSKYILNHHNRQAA